MLTLDPTIDYFPLPKNLFALTDLANVYDPNFCASDLTIGDCFDLVTQALDQETVYENQNAPYQTPIDSIEKLTETQKGTPVTSLYLRIKQPATNMHRIICITKNNDEMCITIQSGSNVISNQIYKIPKDGSYGEQCLQITDLDTNYDIPNLNGLLEAYRFLSMLAI